MESLSFVITWGQKGEAGLQRYVSLLFTFDLLSFI